MRDNKEVDGVMMAHAIETRTGDSPIAQIVINKVETNVEIEDSLFKMPKKKGEEKEK
jgi:outer membrane lipoprotein-sorting protein